MGTKDRKAEGKRGSEKDRIAALKAAGRAPDICGPEMVKAAPARGRVVTFVPTVVMPDGRDSFKVVEMGYRGRSAMREADVFDVMAEQAGRKGAPAPFDRDEVGAARDYRALAERVASAGYKSSMASMMPRRQGKTDFMDAYMRDAEKLRRLHRAIGDGAAMVVRRVRPSDRGTRRTILDRTLVDMVALGDMALSEVLKRHGWRSTGKNIKALREALCLLLDRMQGV